MLSGSISQRAGRLAVALVFLSLCNNTNVGNNTVDAQQMLDGAEDIGLIGSMRHQTNVVPMQRNQFVRDQIVATENDPVAAMNFQAKMKREAPSATAATSSEQQQQQQVPVQTAKANNDDALPKNNNAGSPLSTFRDKLKEHMSLANQQIQKYSDQLAAQIPKRLRRQAQYLTSYAREQSSQQQSVGQQNGNDNGSNGPSSKLAELGDKLHSARQMVQSIRARCAEGYEPRGNERESRLRRQSQQSSNIEERLSSNGNGPTSKLAELGEKLKNRTNEARQLVQSIRQQCAESLGSATQQADSKQQAPSRLRRQAQSPILEPIGPASQQQQQQLPTLFGVGPNSPLAAFTDQVRNQTGAAIQQLQTWRDQVVASVGPMVERQGPKRNKRQIQYPNLEQNTPTGTNGGSSSSGSGGIMKYLGELGQQAATAQAISQMLSAAGASGAQGPGASSPLAAGAVSSGQTASSGLGSVAQMMGQLTDLIKSTQDRNARVLESSQRSLEATNQQTVEAAKSAQGGIQAALSEMGQGLQKLAANNPNLVPDIKNLYQSVSTKLSSASSSVGQTAGQQPQLAPSLPVAQS